MHCRAWQCKSHHGPRCASQVQPWRRHNIHSRTAHRLTDKLLPVACSSKQGPGGLLLISASIHRDIAATDISADTLSTRISNADSSGVNALHILNENGVISGDDDGEIKVWDVRTGAPVTSVRSYEDFISTLAIGPDGDTIISDRGYGILGVTACTATSCWP
jgi:WD40 repeat protein